MSSIGFAVAGTHHYFSHKQVKDDRDHLKSDDGLTEIFRETFHKELSSGDFFVQSVWEQRVRSISFPTRITNVNNTKKIK
jgi:hypothetical protein